MPGRYAKKEQEIIFLAVAVSAANGHHLHLEDGSFCHVLFLLFFFVVLSFFYLVLPKVNKLIFNTLDNSTKVVCLRLGDDEL